MISLVFPFLRADRSFWDDGFISAAIVTCVTNALICLSLLSMAFLTVGKSVGITLLGAMFILMMSRFCLMLLYAIIIPGVVLVFWALIISASLVSCCASVLIFIRL